MKLNKILMAFLPVALILTGATVAYGQIAGYEVVTKTFPGPGGSSAQAACPTGKVVIGGGCELYATSGGATLKDSYPFTSPTSVGNGWACQWSNPANAAGRTAYAVCADGGGNSTQPVRPDIVGSDPTSGATNAQANLIGDGAVADTWENIILVLSGALPGGVDDSTIGKLFSPNDFLVSCVRSDGNNISSAVKAVHVGPKESNISIDVAIDAGNRCRVTHQDKGGSGWWSACFGMLPGDVNQSGTTNTQDLAALADCINKQNCPSWQADINRDGAVNSADTTTLLGLMNGSIGGTRWLNRSLPACPTGSVGFTPVQNQTANAFSSLNNFLQSLRGALSQ